MVNRNSVSSEPTIPFRVLRPVFPHQEHDVRIDDLLVVMVKVDRLNVDSVEHAVYKDEVVQLRIT